MKRRKKKTRKATNLKLRFKDLPINLMGSYYSVNSQDPSDSETVIEPSSEQISSQGENVSSEQETKVYNENPLYIVYTHTGNDRIFYTSDLNKAKDYVRKTIKEIVILNFGYHIQADTDEYDDQVVYTLYKYDPTSLFCRYSFYDKYIISTVDPLTDDMIPLEQEYKKD